MPLYKLGRECVASLPGVANDDIMDIQATVAGQEIDVTTFGSASVTDVLMQVGISEITLEVTCTNHSATIDQKGAFTFAGLDGSLEAVVLSVSLATLTPKGVAQYTVSYGVTVPEAGE